MTPKIDHIDLTVTNLKRAEAFYDSFLPLLGFDLACKEYTQVPEHEYELVEYHSAAFSLGLVSPRTVCAGEKVNRRRPGALHHLAFDAGSREKVDELYKKVSAFPARIIHPPRFYPEYCADYYAFFFKDSEGMELEIVHFNREGYFPATAVN